MNSPQPYDGYPPNLPPQPGPGYPSSPGLPIAPGPPGNYSDSDATAVQGGPAGPDPTGPLTAAAAPPAQGGPVTAGPTVRRHSRIGAAWVALIVAAIVLIFLLIFVLQNSDPVQVRYFGFQGTMALGVAMMFAAAAGALTAGLLGTVRILQLRSKARKAAVR